MISTKLISGPGRQLVSLASALKTEGVDLQIILPYRKQIGPDRFSEFVRDHGITCHVMADRGPVDPLLVWEVGAFLRSWKPDIVQSHSYKSTAVLLALRLLGARYPWVGFFEGATDKDWRDRFYTALELRMSRWADRVVVMSELQRAQFPVPADKIHVVHNSVPDLSRGTRDLSLPSVLQRSRNEGAPVIGVIGRLSPEKGCDIFLEAMALLAARGVDAKAVIIGEGDEEFALKAQAEALKLGARVEFGGFREDVASIYRALDLMVIPSRSEGLPSVLLEAMQADLPVVSTAVGAITEIAAKHPNALRVVPPGRPDQLADAIALALLDLDAPAARAARVAVANEYSVTRRAEVMLSLYSDLLRERGVS